MAAQHDAQQGRARARRRQHEDRRRVLRLAGRGAGVAAARRRAASAAGVADLAPAPIARGLRRGLASGLRGRPRAARPRRGARREVGRELRRPSGRRRSPPRGRSPRSSSCRRLISTAPVIELPPRAKKSSWTPTRARPRSDLARTGRPGSAPASVRGARRSRPRPAAGAASGLGQRPAVHLAVGGQRQRVQAAPRPAGPCSRAARPAR